MQLESYSKPAQKTQFFHQKPVLRLLIIGFLFIIAFSIRVYHINEAPLDFAPTRQYNFAHIARGYYFESMKSIPEWRKQVANINMQRMGFLAEPRILEHIAVFGYHIVGGEQLWIPRALSSIFWLIGGAFLYLVAKKLASTGSALFSTVFYLFLPFGISASRSLQPDPMMVMMLLVSIFTILRYYEKPSILRLLIAATISALAIFIKPYCLFLIFGSFIALGIYKQGIWQSVISSNFLIFTVASLWPTCIYYGYGVITAGDLQDHLKGSFLPHLLLSSYFWKEWLILIGRVLGYTAFIGAIIGVLLFRGLPRALLIGLWIGYLVYGLFANYHIHTHSYYQLQFIPVVALSLGPIGAWVMSRLTNLLYTKGGRVAILVILFVIIATGINIGLNIHQVQWKGIYRDYKGQLRILGTFFGVNPEFNEFITHSYDKEVRIAQEIGEIVDHSTETLLLTSDFGRSLTYHGELSGLPWYTSVSLYELRERGVRELTPEELFNSRYLTIRTKGKYKKYSPKYFIITDFEEFEKQSELKDFLIKNFPIFAQSNDYLIFDLRKMSELNK